ncbi:MAG: creatininase family protein [Planctomycetes bacterium]|nr:creatininase family protein [Planctomycetota bacterium]
MRQPPRPYVLNEANYRQLLDFKPNVAMLPWGATEAHNYHLPHGTDIIEGTALGEMIVERANAKGAKCVLLPTVPFGNDNAQLTQVATITMRGRTQQLVLHDVAESLVRQGIDRLVLLNFHGGNEFKTMIRDIMLDLPIFIVQVHGYLVADTKPFLDDKGGDHANEFETSMMLHLTPEWVQMHLAGDGAAAPFKLRSFNTTPGVWSPRDWATLTKDTGTGNPKQATAEKGKKVLDALAEKCVPILTELSAAKLGDFPFVLTYRPIKNAGQ